MNVTKDSIKAYNDSIDQMNRVIEDVQRAVHNLCDTKLHEYNELRGTIRQRLVHEPEGIETYFKELVQTEAEIRLCFDFQNLVQNLNNVDLTKIEVDS